ncbi:POK8 protein, partial [Eudromia elegans]|nr:POK8 protein [Eudromia elegans]
PWKYLGWEITQGSIRPKKLTLHTQLHTLNEAQRLLGDLQWLQPVVGFTNADLEPL